MTVKAEYKDIPIATAVTESPLTTGETPGYNTMAANKDEGDWVKGEVQPAAFRDVGFGIAFWMQFVAICVLGGFFVTGKIPGEPFWLDDRAEQEDYFEGTIRRFLYQSSGDEEGWEDFDSGPFMWSTLFSFVAAPTVTIFMFSLLYSKAELLITASISISIGFNVALAVLSMIAGVLLGTIMFLFFAAITACYARAIWNRIPYAAANLKTAIASIQSQLAVVFLGLAVVPLFMMWWVLWIFVFVMTLHTDYMESQQISKVVKDLATGDETTIETYSAIWYTIVILLVLSFYWTNQVVGNVVRTTVAGAVGTWWFVPEDATGCCSLALLDSLQRSLTYSFGSICLGSLLVAILQTLKAIAEQAESANRRENNGGGAILACIAKCLLDCLERIVEYFNKWAFIYVGLYGYDYVHAGKNVFNLFQEKGWTAVISDNLTARVLGMLSFGVGIFTAVLAGIICAFLSVGNGVLIIVSAVAAVLIGTIMASIIFSVVNSGVDTVIVLYAEAPNEFHQSHPQLSVNMNEAWNAAWPDIFGQQQWVPAQSAVV